MVVYSILILLTLWGNFFIKKNQRLFLLMMLILLFVVAAIRYDVGTDYVYYKNIYNWITNGTGQFIAKGFYHLTLFVSKLPVKHNYQLLIALSALPLYVAVYFYLTTYLKKEDYQFGLFLLITTGMIFSSYNIYRQYIAIAFGLLALYLFKEKKFISSFIFFVIALLFHKIAIVFLLLLFLLLLARTKYFFMFVMIAYIVSLLAIIIDMRMFVVELLKFNIFDNWEGYANSKFLIERNTSAVVKLIVPNISFLLFAFYGNSYLKSKNMYNELLSGFLCYTLFNNAFYGIIVLTRIGECFYIFYILCTVIATKVFRTALENQIVQYMYILYYIILTVITIFLMGGHGVMPYNIFFNK